ncbi:MAG: hypothetical protein ACJ79S_14130 [Gemmatimonadaceae bacterium]
MTACGGHEIADGVTDSTFVATMAELRRVDAKVALDSAAKASQRAAVLQRRGLTAAQLEHAAGALADDPERAGVLFARIDSVTARPDSADAAPADRRRPAGAAKIPAP